MRNFKAWFIRNFFSEYYSVAFIVKDSELGFKYEVHEFEVARFSGCFEKFHELLKRDDPRIEVTRFVGYKKIKKKDFIYILKNHKVIMDKVRKETIEAMKKKI